MSSEGKFVSRRSLGISFLGGFICLLALGNIFHSEIPLYGILPLFGFYLITTRTNLFGKRVRKQDDGSLKPE